jgi:hypothetical protein
MNSSDPFLPRVIIKIVIKARNSTFQIGFTFCLGNGIIIQSKRLRNVSAIFREP